MKHQKPLNYFEIESNALDYIASGDDRDSKFLIEIIRNHVRPGSTVLELGMGSGRDLTILNETFQATGSDKAEIFLRIYREANPQADLIQLDAETLITDRSFDCLFSNKVLHHLARENLRTSFLRQREVLTEDGILIHTFWKGDKTSQFQGLCFNQYQTGELIEMISEIFALIEIGTYEDLLENDSIYLILKKK